MTALDSMTAAIKGTKIYALTGNTTVDFELQTYAEELDRLYNEITRLETESFAATASDYGITFRLRQFGLPADGGIEERRTAILGMGAVTPDDFTENGVAQALKAAGLPCEITENTAAQKLYLNCPEEMNDAASRKLALKIAKLFLPAHLSAELDFRSISWNNIDRTDASFDEMDVRDISWNGVDCYQDALLQM